MFNFKKIRKNVKAISPVISVLLMIAVAVVASLVAYAWVMGYIGTQTEKTGQAIQIQSVSYDGTTGGVSTFTVYVQNVGTNDVSVKPAEALYINGVSAGTGDETPILNGETLPITGTVSGLEAGLQQVTFKVTTTGGTFSQVTQQFTIVVS
jgi:flagellin-like protein